MRDYDSINDDVTVSGAPAAMLANRYRVIRPLGHGGMGSVCLAEDTKLENRKVAIKMLPSFLVSNRRAYDQLRSEALVSLKLTHQNIAALRAFEENGGNPFLVIDYIDGQTLDDCLAEKGSLSESETLRILKPIAAALDYAHGEGVVHRDVKPANVMIRKDGHPFILDFGIAREIRESMTRVTGKLSNGTLMYMSPEQLDGASPEPAQDVYSFAAMAYECLKGEPPFTRGSLESQIRDRMPEPLGPQFANCGSGIMAGLAKRPGDRPENCAAVLAGGECGTPVEKIARDVSPAAHNVQTIVIGMLSLALLVVGGFALWPSGGDKGSNNDDGPCKPVTSNVISRSASSVSNVFESIHPPPPVIPSRSAGEDKTIELPGGAELELVWCPPCSYQMGSDINEHERVKAERQHWVKISKGFWIGKYEITQKQWESVMGSNPSAVKANGFPVSNVSWQDCQEFCSKAGNGLRLPTEAEWEYACRAGSKYPYSPSGDLMGVGWYGGNSGSTTHGVGNKIPNAWMIYDMHGNVAEWCADWYAEYEVKNATDPTGPTEGAYRVYRGGCWSDPASRCRSAYRGGGNPDSRSNRVGFRVCVSEGWW